MGDFGHSKGKTMRSAAQARREHLAKLSMDADAIVDIVRQIELAPTRQGYADPGWQWTDELRTVMDRLSQVRASLTALAQQVKR